MDLKRSLFALKIKWETVRREFRIRGLIDALFAGVVYATLIAVPVVAVLIELMLISMHRLYFFAVLFILTAAGFVWLVTPRSPTSPSGSRSRNTSPTSRAF
ncbi:MAG: hypothetical protein MZU97_11685 [Bacillus subtilis]|nr:hypothetical protein [Bacillus subtilis]